MAWVVGGGVALGGRAGSGRGVAPPRRGRAAPRGAVGAAISSATPVYDSAGMAGVSGVTTTVEAMLAALAGAVQLEEADREPRSTAKRRRTYSVLPYIAVAAIDGLLVAVTAKLGTGT